MECNLCKTEIGTQDSYVHTVNHRGQIEDAHYCCFLRLIVYELDNNQMINSATGKHLTAGEVMEQTVPKNCPHAHDYSKYRTARNRKKGNKENAS